MKYCFLRDEIEKLKYHAAEMQALFTGHNRMVFDMLIAAKVKDLIETWEIHQKYFEDEVLKLQNDG